MRLPFDGVYTYLRISSFGDNLEFAFFGALTSVGALFIFTEKYLYFWEKRNDTNFVLAGKYEGGVIKTDKVF